jgi:hypothetical protein
VNHAVIAIVDNARLAALASLTSGSAGLVRLDVTDGQKCATDIARACRSPGRRCAQYQRWARIFSINNPASRQPERALPSQCGGSRQIAGPDSAYAEQDETCLAI